MKDIYENKSHFRKAKTSLGHAIHNGKSSVRETANVTLEQNNQTIGNHLSLVTVYQIIPMTSYISQYFGVKSYESPIFCYS